MTIVRVKVIDNNHLELEDELHEKYKEALIKVVDNSPISSLRGAWGYDVDSADFVEKIRKSKQINTIFVLDTSICLDVLLSNGPDRSFETIIRMTSGLTIN